MESHPLYGKKKKKKEICPNPLFVQWLTEWRDDAAEKGIKSQYTYGKALKTLKKFPLRLETGKECKILENFGDKICKMLDDRLAEHVAMYGTTEPVNVPDTLGEVDNSRNKEFKRSAVKRKDAAMQINNNEPKTVAVPGIPLAAARVHDISDSSDDEPHAEPARKRQRSGRQNGEREYIPVYRSGPYALLLTLYRDMTSEESRGFMRKEDLIRKAQPLADKSFTMPDPGSRYTAWSSMGSLIKKGLVIKESSPARYSITDAGCALAHRLEAVQQDHSSVSDTGDIPFRINEPAPHPVIAPNPALPARLPSSHPDDEDDGTPVDHLLDVRNTPLGLKYWYVTEEGVDVLIKDKAAVNIDDEIGVGFLVKCNYTELLKSGFRYKLDVTRPLGDDYVYVYLSNENTSDIATPPHRVNLDIPLVPKTNHQPGNVDDSIQTSDKDKSKRAKSSSKSKKHTPQLLPLIKASVGNNILPDHSSPCKDNVVIIDTDESSKESLPSISVPKNAKISDSKPEYSANNSGKIIDSTAGAGSCLGTYSVTSTSLFERLSAKHDIPRTLSADGLSVDSQASSSQGSGTSVSCSIKSLSSVNSEASGQNFPAPDFVLYPGEFDIVMCIDNAEFYGSSKGSSKTLFPDLIKNGIDCELRKLHVGDLLWLAKEKTRPVPGQLTRPAGRELVLNYIIERKRMDDLVSSCIDGRYKEQKFRLKKCGLQCPMYLIEDYGSMQHFSIPEATLKQAITNTQIIDGFQVKRTKDSKETVAFLTVFTRYLQSHFKDKTLYACSLDEIKESKVVCSISDIHQRLPTFEEFNQGSVKTKALSVQEMFGKQLIQLHGMSAEKARAVIEKYPTPSHLFDAYGRCASEKDKELLLASIKCGKSTRSLGQAQSKQIYQLYNTQTALT